MLIATAGHIDHGKTALVRKLTGKDTDHLPEEQKRGITIDLGFAYWHPDDGEVIGFIDVPGHERYIRTMLAGAHGTDGALIVIAADDGIMPQTREHIAILDFLGCTNAIVAITKCDKAAIDQITKLQDEISALLATTSMAGSAQYPVSSLTGEGIEQLSGALLAMRGAIPNSTPEYGFRMAIDRSFTVTGTGTVVTGTITAGSVSQGDQVTVIPSGRIVRVRGLQSAGKAIRQAQAGQRCAINLANIGAEDLHRGNWLGHPDLIFSTQRLDVMVRLTNEHKTLPRDGTQFQFHHGTSKTIARMHLIRQDAGPDGAMIPARINLTNPISAICGDRFVLRDQSGQHLAGGGVVLNPLPKARQKHNARAAMNSALETGDPYRAFVALLSDTGRAIDLEWFTRIFNLLPETTNDLLVKTGAVIIGGSKKLAVSTSLLGTVGDAICHALANLHKEQPALAGITPEQLRKMLDPLPAAEIFSAALLNEGKAGRIEITGPVIRLKGHKPVFSAAEMELWQSVLNDAAAHGNGDQTPPAPFILSDLVRRLRKPEADLRAMLYRRRDSGDVWAVTDNRFLLARDVKTLVRLADKLSSTSPPGFTAAEFRDSSGLGRNFTIQLLEFFDRIGATVRRGDYRVMRNPLPAALSE